MEHPPGSDRQGSHLSTKTIPPRLPKILPRDECLKLLQSAKGYKIIYISGFAGLGKTTLALSWLKQTRRRVVYLGLDEQDNHPETLLRDLTDAFSVAFARKRFDLPQIPTSFPFEPILFARTYFRSLLSQVQGAYTLVLDEFHEIREEGASGSIFKTLFENLNPGAQIVILSRAMAHSFLSPWLAKRQLFSLDPSVLKFSKGEVSALFREVWGKSILEDEAETLLRITEGWVTGLILLQNRTLNKTTSLLDLPKVDHALSGDRFADYFYHEVYRRLDPALQSFMTQSSLFDSFSISSLASLISQSSRDEVEERVRFLVGHHLLSETPASGKVLYQYHPLLREFLRDRVKELPANERQMRVDRTAGVLLQDGEGEQAVDLYLSHRFFDRVVPLIEKFGMGHIHQGKRQMLLRWIKAVPETYVKGSPWLQFFLGAGREFHQPMLALKDYQSALKGFRAAGDVEGELWALSSLIFLCFGIGRDLRMMKKYADQGRDILKRQKSSCSPAVQAIFLFVDGLTAVYVEVDLPRSLKRFFASARIAHQNRFHSLYISAISFAGIVSSFSGGSQHTPILFHKAEQTISQTKADPFLLAQLLLLHGNVEIYLGDYNKGFELLTKAEKICLDYGFFTLLDPVQINLARARLVLGVPEGWAFLESIQQRVSQSPNRWYEAYLFYVKALFLLQSGDLSGAQAHAEEAIRLLKECGGFLSLNFATCLAGVILREMGDLRKAERYLHAALSNMERGHQTFFIFGVLLHLSKLSIDRGDKAQAKRYLTRALRMGKREVFKEAEGLTYPIKRILIRYALEWKLEPDYVQLLQDYWKVPQPHPLRIHTLGRFEILLHDRPVSQAAWRGRKTRDLLLILLSLGGKEVSKERISNLLWPEADGDRAITNFHTTLHRLQSVLGFSRSNGYRFVDLKGGYLSINPERCWSDCYTFEEEIRQAQTAEGEAHPGRVLSHLEKANNLYQGEFLPGFEEPWIVSRRQELHRKWLWAEHRLKSPSHSA